MMQPTYQPEDLERRWYEAWETAGVFRPEINPDGEPYCIVIPPPNVTGSLHLGHALNMSLQDVILRRKRMQGYAALWVPGSDHAGIATQTVVERELALEGMTRHELGRERFVEQVWQWKERSGNRITEQIRTMGFSCDWSRERFTLDDGLSAAVREVFVRLYEDGLIYRGNRIINWSPGSNSAISDIEVEYRDEVGELVYIEYPLTDGPLPDGTAGITVATTRAETMLGDMAVAVHPDDERYQAAHGKTVVLPLMDREIPVVVDDAVDPEFGTGAVKVTPAHDPLDFEIAKRHQLEPTLIMDGLARITDAGGPYAGLDRFEAREAVKADLSSGGHLVKVEEHHHSVGYCSRTKVPVEPLLSLQWFVAVAELVGPAIDVVRSGETRFVPARWEKSYFHWMENLRDWCISRQLWWGHRIPAWYCGDCGETIVAREDPSACSACGGSKLTPDEDVLDTWFSSALWPFSTLGWPEETDDLATFYPNSVLVTGFDIIYFWVARMLKMGIRFMGETPYPDVVIHGLVRDDQNRKMSKSTGNALDPLDLVEEYGADPLRLALIQAAAPGQDVPFHAEWVAGTRKFGNKLWNGIRFALHHLEPGSVPAEGGYPDEPSAVDAWILARLGRVADRFDEFAEEYRFNDAYGELYRFTWSEVFDWYLELSKVRLEAGDAQTLATLGVVLRDVLKLFHPVIPHLTEELWSHLVGEGLLAAGRWPEVPGYSEPDGMDVFQEVVGGVRQFRSQHGLSPRLPLQMIVVDPQGLVQDWWAEQLAALAAVELSVRDEFLDTTGHTRVGTPSLSAFLPLEGLVDVEAELGRLSKSLEKASADLDRSEKKLANNAFRSNAPADVVTAEEAKRDELAGQTEKLKAQIAELQR